MFFPKSVVVFGVSNSPSNLARVIVDNMDRFKFQGTIYLVGGKAQSMSGRDVFIDLGKIPEIPDMAVFLIPADGLPAALEACGKKGIGRVVIETGGFSEFGEDRKSLEREILSIAAKWGMKIIGPNCVGIVNIENGLVLPFYPLNPHEVKKGAISIISQSGGVVHDLLMLFHVENVGVNKLISIGNKLMLDENDFLEYLISDPATNIIGLYLENIRDGRRLMDIAAATNKPIVLLKSNVSPGSSEIAKFHTSALAGDDRIVDEAMKQAGIIRVKNLKEMLDCLKVFSLPPIKGPRLAMITRSGGHAVLSADSTYCYGFNLASLSDRFFDVLSDKRRAEVIRRTNPVDLGNVYDISVYAEIAEKALQEENVDGVLFIHSYEFGNDSVRTKKLICSCAELSKKYDKPFMFCTIAHKEDWLAVREASDFGVFTHADEALMALSKTFEHFKNHAGSPVKQRHIMDYKEKRAPTSRLPAGIMPINEAFDLLETYGLAVADYRIVKGVDEGLEKARDIGYPVALKSATPGLLHKTEKGGVILDIRDGAALEKGFQSIEAGSYLLQKMAPSGCEVIIGGRNDPEFGPVILCGLGGIFVEVYNDVAIRVAPVDEETARQMLEEIRGVNILKGFRGQQSYDVDHLVTTLINISRLMMDHPEIKTLDINPLILLGNKEGGIVVDTKIEINFLP